MRAFLISSVTLAILVFAFVCGKAWAVPNPERGETATAESPLGVRRALDRGIDILDNLNVKFLKGIGGTKLGIDGPSNFQFQLNKATPVGLLSRLFDNSSSQPERV